MKFRQEGNLIILRLDKGEEIFSSTMAVCRSLNVRCGIISGLGAVSSCTMGVYDVEEKNTTKMNLKAPLRSQISQEMSPPKMVSVISIFTSP